MPAHSKVSALVMTETHEEEDTCPLTQKSVP